MKMDLDDCCPKGITKKIMKMLKVRPDTSPEQRPAFLRFWWFCRRKSYQLVEHKYFETFIIGAIIVSSLTLVFLTFTTKFYLQLGALRRNFSSKIQILNNLNWDYRLNFF